MHSSSNPGLKSALAGPSLQRPPQAIAASAPGRICLFGEHQDYLHLPVIAMAIDLRIEVLARRIAGSDFNVSLPDIGETWSFDPNCEFEYRHNRDYLPATANILRREGLVWPAGYEVTIRSTIPINSGASSSSALQVAWGAFLLAAAGDPRAEDPVCAAELAYRSEVTEFGAPGGMMDHYSSALGGVIWLDCLNPITCRRLPGPVGPFLLIDSGEPKNTNSVLARVRGAVEGALQYLPPSVPGGMVSRLEDLDLASSMNGLTPEQRQILCGTLANRDITTDACRLLLTADCDLPQLGRLLDAHQYQLAERLGVSTPRIDGILALARKAGALGGKINGSGGGGTCFVLCGENLPAIQQVVDDAGFRAWGVTTGAGLRVRQEHP